MRVLEAIVFGLPLICRVCGGQTETVNSSGLCRECENKRKREAYARKRGHGASYG